MKTWMTRAMLLPALSGLILLGVGCEPKGPAEQAGENIDRTADDIGDALDPRGPAEKAGDRIDDTFGN